jgi:hypothetical protein
MLNLPPYSGGQYNKVIIFCYLGHYLSDYFKGLFNVELCRIAIRRVELDIKTLKMNIILINYLSREIISNIDKQEHQLISVTIISTLVD